MEWVKSLELLNLPLMIPYTIPVTAQSIKMIATIDCMTGALKLAMLPFASRKMESAGNKASTRPASMAIKTKVAT